MGKKQRSIWAWFMVVAMILSCLGLYGTPVKAAQEETQTEVAAQDETQTEVAAQDETQTEVAAQDETQTEATATDALSEEMGDEIIRSFPERNAEDASDFEGTGAEAFGNEYAVVPSFVTVNVEDSLIGAPADILPGYADFTPYLTSHKIMVDDKELASGTTIKPDQDFMLNISFSMDIQDMAQNGLDYYFPLPDHISIGDKGSEENPITLYNNNLVAIGTYFIKDDVLYVSFPGYYDSVVAFFELDGNWSNTANRTSINVPWPDKTDTYKIDLCDLSIQKSQQSYITQTDGSLRCKFSSRTTPSTEGASISDITFTDTFSHSNKMHVIEDTYGAGQAVKVSIYNADKSLKSVQFYSLADVMQAYSGGTKMVITGLAIENGGYFIVDYESLISMEDRIAIDGTGTTDHYINTAVSSYEYYDTSLGHNVTLSASSKVEAEYRGGTDWIMKNASDETKTKYQNGENKLVVPYIITINKHRPYSLGGSAVKDEITGFVGGDVVYDTSASAETHVEWITSNSSGDVEQKWVILDPATHDELKALCTKSPDTTLHNLRANDALETKLVNAVNTAYGTAYTEFTDELALTYVFTDAESHNFVWIMPDDTMPTSYTIHYDTIVDSTVGDFTNGAGLWYTDYEGAPGGTGGWSRPVKKVMNATKSNAGVYIGSDGNYYVDYTLTVGVEAGSAGFEDIAVRDIFPYHPVELDDGVTYNVFDWLAGFDADSVDISTITTAENINLVSSVVDISTTSTDPAVLAVLENAYAGYFYEVSGDTNADSFREKKSYPWNSTQFYSRSAWNGKPQGGTYYGKATPAGQFVVKNDMYNWSQSNLLNRKGGTFSPGALMVWFGNLPGTEEGYQFVIKYTMQINPMLIEKLPEVLQREGNDYVTNVNRGEVWTSFRRANFTYNTMNFRTNTKLQQMDSPYWLGINDEHPGVDKTVVGPSADNAYVTYEVTADPGRNIPAGDMTYELTDELNVSGMKYRPNSFTIRDTDNAVVWTNNPSVTVASKYSGYADLINLSVTNSDRDSNGYVFTFDNSVSKGSKFTDENGKFMILKVTYDVEMGDISTDTTIQNTAGLFELETDGTDGTVKRRSLGEATVEYAIDKAIDKHISEKPGVNNEYAAEYYIDINPTSENAAKVIRTTDAYGNVTETKRPYEVGDVLEVRDTLSDNQALLGKTIRVYKYQGINFVNETDITDQCSASFDPDSHTLSVDITIEDLAYRYRIVYSARVEGASNTLVPFNNSAKLDHSTAKVDDVRDRVLVFEYSGGSNAYVYRIDLHKSDQYEPDVDLSATFDLYKLDGTSWTLLTTGDENYEQIQTDASGYASIQNMVVNTQPILKVEDGCYYKLVEADAPDGYVLDATPVYYYVSETGEAPEAKTIPAQVPKDMLKVIRLKNSMDPDSPIPVIELTNQRFGFDIQKKDSGSGELLPGAAFKLYTDEACTNELASAEDGNSVSKSGNAVYDADEDGVTKFRDLEITANTQYLYLKETAAPAGYKDKPEVIRLEIENCRVKAASTSAETLAVSDSGRISVIDVPNDYLSGRLLIKKSVTNADADHLDRSFSFSAMIYDASGSPVTLSYPYTKTDAAGNETKGSYRSGSVFTLKSDEEMMISGIRDGYTYKVKEVRDNEYKTTVSVADSAGTDARGAAASYEADGSIEESELDTVSFVNEARVSLTVTKKCVTERDEPLPVPDGLGFSVSSGNTIYATIVYDAASGKYKLDQASEVTISLENVENGFKVSGLPYTSKAYHLAEMNKDIDGMACVLTNDIGSTVRDNSWFEFHADNHPSYGGVGIDNTVAVNLTNTYTETYVEAELIAYKDYSKAIPEGKFTFELYSRPYSTSTDRVLVAEATVGANREAVFPKMKYTKAGTFYYEIREKIPEGAVRNVKDGTTYDSSRFNVVVNVVKNAATEDLEVESITYSKGSSPVNEVRFTNTYSAAGSVKLPVTKNYNKAISNATFSFELKEYTDDTYRTEKFASDGGIDPKTVSTRGTASGAPATAYFDTISYTLDDVGMHYYRVREMIPGGVSHETPIKDGIRYDLSDQYYAVNVQDNDRGELVVTVTDGNGRTGDEAMAEFTNEYIATGDITFYGTKRMTYRDMEAGEFTFVITEYTTSGRTEVKKDASGADIIYTGTNKAAETSDENGIPVAVADIEYPTIEYGLEDAGMHYYTVTEQIPEDAVYGMKDGTSYSTMTYFVNVNVQDNGIGELIVNPTDNFSNLDFSNTYTATGKLNLVGKKTLNGRSLENAEFDTMADIGSDTGSYFGRNEEDGTIKFRELNFTEDDIGKPFTFTVYEFIPQTDDLRGVTYDTEVYTVTVDVGPGSKGKLDIQTTIKNSAGTVCDSIEFINEYDAEASVTFTADKKLLGRELDDADTQVFDFEIVEGNTVVATGSNAADGSITFTPIRFYIDGSKTGVDSYIGAHDYVVREVKPDPVPDGYTYDESTYPITVTATDDGDGCLSINVSGSAVRTGYLKYEVEKPEGAEAAFTNYYEAFGDFTMRGTKTLTGRTLDDGEFTFLIEETKYDAVADAYLSTGRTFNGVSDDAGVITYDTIDYVKNDQRDDTGLYIYHVSEVVPAEPLGGVTYDTTEYDLPVRVTDEKGDGVLYVYSGMGYDAMDFVNTYEASARLTVSAEKLAETDEGNPYDDTLTDGTAAGNTFAVEVYEIRADGSEEFRTDVRLGVGEKADMPGILYDLTGVGLHQYRIVERKENAAGYTYCTDEKEITIKVEDGRKGILNLYMVEGLVSDIDTAAAGTDASITVFADGEAKTDFTALNIYSASGSANLQVTKKVENLDRSVLKTSLKENMFLFDLTEYEPAVGGFIDMETVGNDATGLVTFTTIDYTMMDVGTHIYRIRENREKELPAILYMAEDIFAVVTVSNNGDGTLTADVVYTNESDLAVLAAGGFDALSEAEMRNRMTETRVLKTDDKGTSLPGAKLTVFEADGKGIYAFTSGEKAEVIYGLERGKEYILRELSAPEGYELAADIRFKLDKDGALQILKDGKGIPAETLVMADTPVETLTKSTNTSKKTGDDMPLRILMHLMLVSAGMIIFILRYRKSCVAYFLRSDRYNKDNQK